MNGNSLTFILGQGFTTGAITQEGSWQEVWPVGGCRRQLYQLTEGCTEGVLVD